MKIVFLDIKTLGFEMNTEGLNRLGHVEIYDNISDRHVPAFVTDADVIITNQNNLNEKNLKDAENLKLICAAATGYNNIDVDYCRKRGIAVANVPGYAAKSVAQHTFAMLFYMISHSKYYDEYIRSGNYSSGEAAVHSGRDFFELEGKTWGIIGLGEIGKTVGRYAQGFGCRVIYYSTSGRNDNAVFERKSLDELLRASDIVSVHAPLNNDTRRMIGMNELMKMKKSAYILNLGRGGIIDEKDLAEALDRKLISGAGLDVFETEPLPPDSVLIEYANRADCGKLYMTPHIGYGSAEARERLMRIICENIAAFFEGRILNRVD